MSVFLVLASLIRYGRTYDINQKLTAMCTSKVLSDIKTGEFQHVSILFTIDRTKHSWFQLIRAKNWLPNGRMHISTNIGVCFKNLPLIMAIITHPLRKKIVSSFRQCQIARFLYTYLTFKWLNIKGYSKLSICSMHVQQVHGIIFMSEGQPKITTCTTYVCLPPSDEASLQLLHTSSGEHSGISHRLETVSYTICYRCEAPKAQQF